MIGITNSNTSTIYVGPTEPTSGVRIWLDTDEQGASAVNSVNGKAGTVVIDDIPMTLLWTNASPTSNFAAQTVLLDLSGYDLIAMTAYFSGAASYVLPTLICKLGETAYFTTVDSQNKQYWRTAKPQATGVVYSRGVVAGAEHNDALIPYQIWGIKLS